MNIRILAIVVSTAALAACVNPYIMSATPASVSVGYDPVVSRQQSAADLAQAHCRRYGKNAEFIQDRHSGGLVIMHFRCV